MICCLNMSSCPFLGFAYNLAIVISDPKPTMCILIKQHDFIYKSTWLIGRKKHCGFQFFPLSQRGKTRSENVNYFLLKLWQAKLADGGNFRLKPICTTERFTDLGKLNLLMLIVVQL